MKRMFRCRLNVALCMTMISGMTMVPVQATDYNTPVPRIPNDPVDINTLCVATIYESSSGEHWSIENNTLTYEGKEIPIYVQAWQPVTVNTGISCPDEDYTVEIEGDNIRKVLVKEGYTDYKDIYGNVLYPIQDRYDSTNYDYSTLMSFYKLAQRLNIKPSDQHIMVMFKTIIPLLFTLDELRQYSCAREFAEKTADMWDEEPYLCDVTGYISEFNDTITPKMKKDGYSSIEEYMDHVVCDSGDGVSYWQVDYQTYYPLYFVVPRTAITESQAQEFGNKNNSKVYKNSENWYFCAGEWTGNNTTAPYYAKQKIPEHAKTLGIDESLMTVQFEPDVRKNYSTYYAFSEKDALNAWADEMDTWAGHWDFYLYGDTHFTYRVSCPSTTPGYYAINWGDGANYIMDRLVVQHDPKYEYYITGPGDFTVTATGKNIQDGRGRVNLVGTQSYVVHVNGTDTSTVLTGPANSWRKIEGDWYHFSSDERMEIGWKYIKGLWYYFDNTGKMQTGWLLSGGSWYYMNKNGAMVTGWLKYGGAWYYMDSRGAMVTGWMKYHNTWYFLKSSGAMATGWVNDGGTWYYMNDDGTMACNTWIGNYFLLASGEMAVNMWIGSWYVGSDGAWVPDK